MAKTEQSSSRMDTVLKMLLIAFVSLLAFSTGVYFGKQMSDSDHQLKALESDFNTQNTMTAANSEKSDEAGGDMNEADVASISEKYVKEEAGAAKREVASEHEEGGAEEHAAPAAHGASSEHAASTKTAAHESTHEAVAEEAPEHSAPKSAPAKTEKHVASGPDLSAAHRAAERVANNAAPTTAAAHGSAVKSAGASEESRVPSSLPKTVGTNGSVEFTVQVASYPTAEAAKSYANDLVKKGFPAFPVEATINGKTWYRVSVGSFKTMKEASTYRAQLLKQADLQNAIVQKITR